MPSSKSSSSSRSSNSSSMNNSSRTMTKNNYYILVLLAIVAILFAIYYFTYKSNHETFSSSAISSSSSGAPNLKASKGETVVALFYADWCPHCVAFKPDYTKAMSTLNGKKYKGNTLRLELVDCVANKSIASENSVSGFPTVKIFNDDKTSSEYSGERSYEGMMKEFA